MSHSLDRLRQWSLDRVMARMDRFRARALAQAHGRVLEVGFGTGLNLDHYPGAVTSVTALDTNASLLAATAERVERAPFPVTTRTLAADEGLPFDDASFDCVVTTWCLCSIAEPLDALAEMRRVLAPDGRYVFIEHGRSERTEVARWQDRLNPLWCKLAGGCNMNRPIDELVRAAGFEVESLSRFQIAGPSVLSQMYQGAGLLPR